MNLELIKAIVILPGTALVYVPGALLRLAAGTQADMAPAGVAQVEEPGLQRRFGDDYRRYKANVPRWVPRATPWEPPEETRRERGGRRSVR